MRTVGYGILIIIGVVAIGTVAAYCLPMLTQKVYVHSSNQQASVIVADATTTPAVIAPQVPTRVVTHIPTPASVKAIYMTSWVAGTAKLRDHVLSLLNTTEANAIVIDIKDSTGQISFHIDDPVLEQENTMSNRIPNIDALIDELHAKHIYVIGRIATFEDPSFVKNHPEYGIKTQTDQTKLWADKKGTHWLDAGEEPVWNYVSRIAQDSYDLGFDEINFDYIRFPSDGNMQDIWYPVSEGKIKSDVINSFFTYLDTTFHTTTEHVPISGDLFGLTTEADDDLGIGQLFSNAVAHFDFVCPMVYPSAYAPGSHGFKNPAQYPTQMITDSMGSAVTRTKAAGKDPSVVLRPWLQDFNLGATYTAAMVRDEITADYALGLKSWSLWDPNNVYTPGALLPKSGGN